LQVHLFICGSARKSKHKPLFKFTWNYPFFGSFRNPWNLPFRKFLQLNSFATNEICLLGSFSNSFHFATFATFCNVIATFIAISLIFATLFQPVLFIATFLHCNYWQNALRFANFIHCIYYAKVLPCNLLHGFNLRDTVVFIITKFFLEKYYF